MYGGAIPWRESLRGKHQGLFLIFILNVPLITLEIETQYLENSLDSQKQWKYVPVLEWHLLQRRKGTTNRGVKNLVQMLHLPETVICECGSE